MKTPHKPAVEHKKKKTLEVLQPGSESKLSKLKRRKLYNGDSEDFVSLNWVSFWIPKV